MWRGAFCRHSGREIFLGSFFRFIYLLSELNLTYEKVNAYGTVSVIVDSVLVAV